ncbi:hypothetical protein HanXRQr2_Chr17g0816061 [Helianthus annuus]|uniref:SERRATE/Ars2 N-terminal domain-containing protein n=1 Tax=Helianthus annuus TaxID=4232 RepID=A0A9K3DJE4_HELAN|nr:hypothetical protein HanXRQr2_Chr17g0816061 [Helianthus annuus]
MSYKQFIQELEDDVLPSEAEQRYQEYKSEYISTQKWAYFDAHKGEDWLKDKYHPTNLLVVIESYFMILFCCCTMSLFLPLGNKGECISQLLLVLSKMNLVFSYVPEFYLETLVDCFHVLRKSDPPFVYKTRTWFICTFHFFNVCKFITTDINYLRIN